MDILRDIYKSGEKITISGLDDNDMNGDWYITDVSIRKQSGEPDHYYWNISLKESLSLQHNNLLILFITMVIGMISGVIFVIMLMVLMGSCLI